MVVKYSTSPVNNTIKTNNIVFGNDTVEYGPTSSSGFWNGITPPSSGYTIYTVSESRQEPSIVCPANDTEAIYFARSFGGTNINTIEDALLYLTTGSTNTTVVNMSYPNIVTDGLIIYLDGGLVSSYPKIGDIIYDLSGNNNNCNKYTEWDSSGYFKFPGGTYNRITTTPLSLQGDPNFTVFGAFKRNDTFINGASWGIGGDGNLQGFNNWNSSYSDQITMDLWGISTYTCGQTYPLEQWVLVHWIKTAGEFTTNSCVFFVNDIPYRGNQISVIRGGTGTPSVSSNGVVMGRPGGITNDYYAKVDVGCLIIYDRVLSDVEVMKNFNALKGRYGL